MSIGIGISLVNFAAVISSVPSLVISAVLATVAAAPSVPANKVNISATADQVVYWAVEFWVHGQPYATRLSVEQVGSSLTCDIDLDSASVDAGLLYDFQVCCQVIAWPSQGGSVGSVSTSNVGTFLVDQVAATLTSPTAGTITTSSAVPSVSTDEANGTIYCAIVTSGGSCTDAQLKAGSGGNIVVGKASNQPVTQSATPQVFAAVTGLTIGTAYDIKYLHRNTNGRDSAQSSASFTTQSALAVGLTYYYKGNETTGNDVAHDAVDGGTLAIQGANCASVTGNPSGNLGTGRQFASGYFNLDPSLLYTIPDINTAYTFAVWVDIVSLVANQRIIGKRTGSSAGPGLDYIISSDTSGNVFLVWGEGASSAGNIQATQQLAAGTYKPIICGYDPADSHKFFVSVNGETKVKSATVTTQTVNQPSNILLFGTDSSAAPDSVFKWQALGFWVGHALTQAEITQYVNGGAGLALSSY